MKKALTTLTALLLFAILFVSCEVDKNTVYIFSGESLIDVAFVEVNGKYTLPRSPERDGYTFSGWRINGGDVVRNAGEEITVTGNTKVTAVWIRLCTVTFDMDGGLEQKALTLEEGQRVPKPVLAVKAGYDLSRWVTEDGDEYDFATPLEGDITLTAVWKYHEYSIGDIGPAGGYIFYDCDKDNESGNADKLESQECGWRYLEAASAAAAPTASWGDEIEVRTEPAIGKGKTNTDRLLRYTEYNPYYFEAAEKAAEYTSNGYDDWFLPSEKELLAILSNETLKKAYTQKYWSSTADESTAGDYTKVKVCSASSGSESKNRNLGTDIITTTFLILPVRSF